MRWICLLLLGFALVVPAAGCATEEETVKEGPAEPAPEQPAPEPTGKEDPPPPPPKEPPPPPKKAKTPGTQPGDRIGGDFGFTVEPVAGLLLFGQAAAHGVSPDTVALMEAAGMKRSPNTLLLYYRAKPFLGLAVERSSDKNLTPKTMSEEAFNKLRESYKKFLGPFGMVLQDMERFKAGPHAAVLVEYRRRRKPYLKALSAMFYGLDAEGRVVTITYTADSFSWDEALRKKLLDSLATFRLGAPAGKDGK